MRNGCAQRALASLLGRDARSLYDAHPPDTPFALLGTTPWGFERMARAAGAGVARVRGEAALRDALARGPVVLLLDARRLGGPFGYHYAVARGLDERGVRMTHLATGPPSRVVPWAELRRAWRSWMPGAYRETGFLVTA